MLCWYPVQFFSRGNSLWHLPSVCLVLILSAPCLRALREQVLAQATTEDGAAQPSGDYKGINNYTDYKKVGHAA